MNPQTNYNPPRSWGTTAQGTPILQYYPQAQAQERSNHPLKTFQAGQVRAVIWENNDQGTDREGKPYVRTRHTIQIERRYKSPGGEWKSSSTFFLPDLQKIEVVLRKAQDYLLTSEREEVGA